jgi:hypothetical protein
LYLCHWHLLPYIIAYLIPKSKFKKMW